MFLQRHLLRARAVTNQIFFIQKDLFSSMFWVTISSKYHELHMWICLYGCYFLWCNSTSFWDICLEREQSQIRFSLSKKTYFPQCSELPSNIRTMVKLAKLVQFSIGWHGLGDETKLALCKHSRQEDCGSNEGAGKKIVKNWWKLVKVSKSW